MYRTLLNWKRLSRSTTLNKRYKASYLAHVKRDDETELFLSAFPEVIETLTKCNLYRDVPQFTKRYGELIEYTVLKEKRFRPSITLKAYKELESPEDFSVEKLHLAIMFSWSVELIHTAMIVKDDVWDQTIMRGNEIAWYRKPNVGLISINDATLLYQGAFTLTKKYFSALPEYIALLEIHYYMILMVGIGQSLLWDLKGDGKVVYDLFTMKHYRTIARHKGAAPIVEGPIMGALTLTKNVSHLENIRDVLIELGIGFQVDNDILDVYEKDGKIRKDGSDDVTTGRHSWLCAKILESGNEKMISDFKRNYGRPEPEYEAQIIKIFTEFGIFEKYCQYRKSLRQYVQNRVSKMTPSLGRAILSTMENVLPNVE